MLSIDELTHRVLPYLKAAGVVGDPVHDSRRAAARAGDAAGGRADEQAHRGRRHARLPVRQTTPTFERHDEIDDAGRRRGAGGVRRARRAAALVDRRDRGGAAHARWSTGSASSRGSRSGRCGSRSPVARSRRRSSSRSSCSAVTAAWPGSRAPSRERLGADAPAAAPVREGLPYHLRAAWRLARQVAPAGRRCSRSRRAMLLVLPLLVMVPFAVYYAATGQEVGSSVDPARRPHAADARRTRLPQPRAGRADPAGVAADPLPPRTAAALGVVGVPATAVGLPVHLLRALLRRADRDRGRSRRCCRRRRRRRWAAGSTTSRRRCATSCWSCCS